MSSSHAALGSVRFERARANRASDELRWDAEGEKRMVARSVASVAPEVTLQLAAEAVCEAVKHVHHVMNQPIVTRESDEGMKPIAQNSGGERLIARGRLLAFKKTGK